MAREFGIPPSDSDVKDDPDVKGATGGASGPGLPQRSGFDVGTQTEDIETDADDPPPVSDKGLPRAARVILAPLRGSTLPGCRIDALPSMWGRSPVVAHSQMVDIPPSTRTMREFLKRLLATTQWKFVGGFVTLYRASPKLVAPDCDLACVPRLVEDDGYMLDSSSPFEPHAVIVVTWNSCVCRKLAEY